MLLVEGLAYSCYVFRPASQALHAECISPMQIVGAMQLVGAMLKCSCNNGRVCQATVQDRCAKSLPCALFVSIFTAGPNPLMVFSADVFHITAVH